MTDDELPKIVQRRALIPRRATWPQSGCGIASFVIGLISFIIFVASWTGHQREFNRIMRDYEAAPESEKDEVIMRRAFAGPRNALPLFVSAVIALVGFVLGIAGLFQPCRQQSLAWLGISLNFLPAVLLVLFLAL